MSAIQVDTSALRETVRTLEGVARSVENAGAGVRSRRGKARALGHPRAAAAADALLFSILARISELSVEARNLGRIAAWAAARYESVEDAVG